MRGICGIDEPKLKVQRNIDVWVSLSLKHSAIAMSTQRPGNQYEEYSNCHPSHPIILVGYAWFIRILIQLYARKLNSSPLKIGQTPKGKVCLPFPSFFRGKLAVKFRGCIKFCPDKQPLASRISEWSNHHFHQLTPGRPIWSNL